MTSNQTDSQVEIYQFHVLLLEISPAIWRRFLIRSDSTIQDLHYTLQIVMGWEDEHLQQFLIHGKYYGVAKPGGVWFRDDPTKIKLSDLKLRLKERFLYHYDLGVNWQHQLRLEQILPISPSKSYPFCTHGSRIIPPEECGGPEAFMEIEPKLELALWRKKARLVKIMAKILPALQKEEGLALIEKHRTELKKILEQLAAAKFERGEINRQLKLYGSSKIWQPKEIVFG